MINKTTVLLIQNDLRALSELSQQCIEAGICEKNIFSVSDSESAERYLEIAGVSYVIIDADLYNFVVASTIEKFSAYFPIQTVITNAEPEQITLRMLNDKTLTFLNSPQELGRVLHGNTRLSNYPYSEISSFQNI